MCFPDKGTLANISLGSQVAGGIVSAKGAYDRAKSERTALEYQAAVTQHSAMVEELRARDALRRGAQKEASVRLKTAQTKGRQRAIFAARGVALDEGSALSIIQDTEYIGELDAQTVRDNTAAEAWALRVSAGGQEQNAALLRSGAASISPLKSTAASLLTSTGTVAKSWYRYKTSGVI